MSQDSASNAWDPVGPEGEKIIEKCHQLSKEWLADTGYFHYQKIRAALKHAGIVLPEAMDLPESQELLVRSLMRIVEDTAEHCTLRYSREALLLKERAR